MSGTRFARTGRCRFLVCFGILVLMVGMVVIFHNSQISWNETTRELRHCEQQQEALNERLTSLVEQKFHLEKNQERERTEYLENRRNLEQRVKDLEEKYQKEKVETQMHYDKLQQAQKLLQDLKDESVKTNKEHLENINGLENKLQSLKSEIKKEKSNKSGEVYLWKEKYNTAEQETKQQIEHMKVLEKQLNEYRAHCEYNGNEISRKPVAPKPHVSVNGNPSTSQRTFKIQEPIVPKPIKGMSPEEETQIDQQPVESAKHQAPPLSAPKHKSSTPTSKSEQQMIAAASVLNATSATRIGRDHGSSSTSNSPPLAFPPNQKKLPANVAPYPENFEDLLQKSNNNEQSKNADVDTNKNDENVDVGNHVKDSPLKASNNNNNYDFGANNNNMNDDSNLPHDEDINNFFDTDNDKDHHKHQKGDDDDALNNDDDNGLLGADNDNDGDGAGGDIAVKHNQQQLDDNLKNEIAEDQGKEFGDGLHLDENPMEEDDDDDYSIPRKKADKAIRH